jgi:Flp pilus assembly pilin Flp
MHPPARHLPPALPTAIRRTIPPAIATAVPTVSSPRSSATAHPSRPLDDEDGSLVTEYGLLAVVAATIAGVVISWASNGALVALFNALLRHARGLVGA